MDKTKTAHTGFKNLSDDLKNIIVKADSIWDHKKRAEFFDKNSDIINTALTSLQSSDIILFGIMLRVLSRESGNSPVPLIRFQPSKEVCLALERKESEIREQVAGFNFWRAKELYENVRKGKHVEKYTERHRLIESAITLVWEQFDPSGKWLFANIVSESDACFFIAECYLVRSKLALPKGADIPEKKLEALAKAWNWACKGSDDTDGLKIRIALETERWDKTVEKGRIKKYLTDFLEKHKFNIRNPLHWAVNDRAASLGIISEDNDKKIINHSLAQTTKKFFPLYQARAGLRLGISDISEQLEKAVNALENVPLSDPLWNETADLLEKIAQDNTDFRINNFTALSGSRSITHTPSFPTSCEINYLKICNNWKKPAIMAWKECQKAENRIRLSIQVRWYWAGYRRLYDLAFKAAFEDDTDMFLALEITDSLKSRPTIKMQSLEKSLKQDDTDLFKKYVEAESLFAADIYIPDIESLKTGKPAETKKNRDFRDIPDGWAGVHFNITAKNKGYALIVENQNCHHMKIEIAGTWEAFQEWNAERKNFGIEDSESSLKELCKESGKMLEPLLEIISKKGIQNIIFVPHSFLHLVPLHASKTKDKYLFQEKTSLFLPSWSMAPVENTVPRANDNDILLTNWKDSDIGLIEREKWANSKTTENSSQDFSDTVKAFYPPRMIVLFCHGQGDFINPYQSKFLMKESFLTHQAILQNMPDLKGARVILTACESDLVSDDPGLTDEHLSLAGAFLSKGAGQVAGALFACLTDVSQDLVLAAKKHTDKPLCQILQEKQAEWLEKKSFHKIAAFRVMGFPLTIGD